MSATKRTLPKGWRWTKFEELIAEAQSGFASGQRDPNGVIQLRMNNVDTRGNILWDEFIRVPTDQAAIQKFSLKSGDIVFNNTNSTELVGKSALFKEHIEPVTFSNHFTRLRVKPDLADSSFVTFWLISQWQARTFENICNRWIGQSAVKTDKLFSLEIPLPPIDAQKQIASSLEEQMRHINQARQAAEESLYAAWELPSVYLQDVFDKVEQTMPSSWHWANLGEICQFKRGPFGGSLKKDIFVNQGYKIYEQQHAIKDDFEIGRYFITEEKYKEMEAFAVKPNDLIVSCSGTMGKIAIIPQNAEPGIINQALLKLTPLTNNILSSYLKIYLQSEAVQKKYFRGTAGTAIQNVAPVSELKQIKIPVPPIKEQEILIEEIEEKYKMSNSIIDNLESQLAEINELPSALLRQAFAGGL